MANDPRVAAAVARAASIKEELKDNHFVSGFAAEAKKLLDKTNRPNVITLEQFAPYVELFRIDKEQYILPDQGDPNEYTKRINKLYNSWRHQLGINHFEVTYVITSKTDDTVVYYLDRTLTRVHSDMVDANSTRSSVPDMISRGPASTRDDFIMKASYTDLLAANQSDKQDRYFGLTKIESMFITNRFTENNMAPDKRPKLVETESSAVVAPVVTSGSDSGLFDDDDD